ncbi:hypothetical protein QOZ80_7BG0603390 [Eleusine coracana subsp. coracana]|nr:hypothetical protein QOZ80_7BG0603390 [Eleusine coracana subsp. coracana]
MTSPATGALNGGGLTSPLLVNANGATTKKAGIEDKYWVAADEAERRAARESGGEDGRPLLFRTYKLRSAILHPYRALILVRLIAVVLFFVWRIRHNDSNVMWFWTISVAGDAWFGFSWLLNQLPKFNPVKSIPDLAALKHHYDLPDGTSKLPGIDVFVTTADPVNEPILCTMNSVLSILAADYPVDRYACYVSDDSGALILYEALVEVANFAALWVPFCRKHSIEPRAPESYFALEVLKQTEHGPEGFMNEYKRVQMEYNDFKMRLDNLSDTIRKRSDEYNSKRTSEGDAKATWMANGTQWPGTWIDPTKNHNKGHHVGIVKVVLDHPSHGHHQCPEVIDGNTGVQLPMLVYVSREKNPSYDHNQKAGALNAQLRVSALLSNAQFIINFDCDHYINNSEALRAAVCFMLDQREGDNIAFVQFPQRFDNVDPSDRYGNHNRVFFDGTMLALNGLQGPSYLGTGCMFLRIALYGIDPPHYRPDNITAKSNKFGESKSFLDSVSQAIKQERPITPPPIDDAFVTEMEMVVTASYDKGTDWGKGVGYIYDIATEDIVTGFRIHGQGWRSMYCTMEHEAFCGTAPINLTERLHQIVRWSGGSLEMFFSHNNPLIGGQRVQLLQRVSYLNMTIYPVTSIFILLYALCPVMWLVPYEVHIQRPFTIYVVYLLIIIMMIHIIGWFEMKWAGVTWMDYWRNEQFFMIGSMSAYPAALLHMAKKLLTKKDIHFRVTSKQTTTDTDDKFADLYEMRWVPMLIPTFFVLVANVGAIGVAMGKAVVYMGVWTMAQKTHAGLGLLFNVWIMVLLHPFALAIMGRFAKRPIILVALLPLVWATAAIYNGIGARSPSTTPVQRRLAMAAAVTRRIHASLHVEHSNGVGNGESLHNSAGAYSPVAKRISDAKDSDVWVAVEEGDVSGAGTGNSSRAVLFRTMKVKGSILHPYRFLILVRLIAIVAFFTWRIKHKNQDGVWLWYMSMVGDVWFGFSWLLNQLPKLNPIKRVPDLTAIRDQYDSSKLPGIDVFVTTVDPVDEPILYTVNSILSILATDYPVEKYACYLSDDGGSLIHYEAMFEVAKFAELWVPFCRKHRIEPRAPENYFGVKRRPYIGTMQEEFKSDHRRVRREYEEFKVRIESLFTTIHQRSEVYNSKNGKEHGMKGTWMADGTLWPGTWFEPAENHRKGQHAGIVQVILNHPSHKPQLGLSASIDNPFDFSNIDMRLPMLVYLSREKRPGYNHQKKAGAMNVMLRVSALLSNAPFIINFDCDHYISNSQAFHGTMCFMLDPSFGQNTAFVQFPQRFDDVDPTDRYANHNRVFFDGTMLSLNGLQGPSYLGTGCTFRRVALYGMEPPRWRVDNIKVTRKIKEFGKSTLFINSMLDAANQDRSITPMLFEQSINDELTALMSCAYEDGTSWGRDVGWVYNIATEDVVTGFRMHRQGWRSMYCSMEPAAFRGTAPINLTERLLQILRWSGGSLEMFFSHSNAFLAGRRMHPLQRIAYLNMSTYPIVTVFILAYNLFPVMWLISEQFYIQRPFGTYILYLITIIAMIHVIGMFEVKWASITLLDWCRNEQFYMIGSTGVYPTAVLYMVLKLITGKGIYFRLTSKQTEASSNDKFADLYVVRWVPLLIPTIAVLVVNVAAVGLAIGKAATWGWFTEQAQHALLGMVFNVWILVLLYPFGLGIMGQWGKKPIILFIILVMAIGAVAITHVTFHAAYQTTWSEIANSVSNAKSVTGSSG